MQVGQEGRVHLRQNEILFCQAGQLSHLCARVWTCARAHMCTCVRACVYTLGSHRQETARLSCLAISLGRTGMHAAKPLHSPCAHLQYSHCAHLQHPSALAHPLRLPTHPLQVRANLLPSPTPCLSLHTRTPLLHTHPPTPTFCPLSTTATTQLCTHPRPLHCPAHPPTFCTPSTAHRGTANEVALTSAWLPPRAAATKAAARHQQRQQRKVEGCGMSHSCRDAAHGVLIFALIVYSAPGARQSSAGVHHERMAAIAALSGSGCAS